MFQAVVCIVCRAVCESQTAFVGDKNISVVKMHGATVKIIDAQQAKLRNNYNILTVYFNILYV